MLEEVLAQEEKYLIDTMYDEDVGGVMQGDIEGAFHRIRSALASTPPAEGERVSNAERELMIAIADALSSLLHHQIVGGNGVNCSNTVEF